MGGRDLELRNLGAVTVDPVQALAAVRNIARRFDHDPAGLLELLKILGLPTTKRGLDALKARAALDRAAHRKEQQ